MDMNYIQEDIMKSHHFTLPKLFIVGLISIMLGACGAESGPSPDPSPDPNPVVDPVDPKPEDNEFGEILRSSEERLYSLNVSDPDMEALAQGNNALAFDLYHELNKDEDGNLFYSPHSISQALAMAYAGAKGNTAAEMAAALHYTLPQDRLHPAENALDQALASRGQGAQGMDGKGFRLKVSNASWGQIGYSFAAAYLDLLAQHYDAGLRLLNFAEEAEPSRKIINSWVEQETEGKIAELLPQGSILESTRMVLTNTIYFNAAWDVVFPEENSGDRPFSLLDGSTVTAPAMSHADMFNYGTGDGYQALEMLYDGKELSMLIVLPEAGRYAEIEDQLDADFIDGVVAGLSPETVAVTLPKWKFRFKKKLKKSLEGLGMIDAFSSSADFTGINGGIEALWISEVIHEGYINVNEKGTEAAAATAVVMIGSGMSTEMRADRPFIFLIRDIQTNTILFVGRVVNPME